VTPAEREGLEALWLSLTIERQRYDDAKDRERALGREHQAAKALTAAHDRRWRSLAEALGGVLEGRAAFETGPDGALVVRFRGEPGNPRDVARPVVRVDAGHAPDQELPS
jgi:hypothetical protein